MTILNTQPTQKIPYFIPKKMNASQLFLKTQQLYSTLLDTLQQIESSNTAGLPLYENCLMEIDTAIRQVKTWLTNCTFSSAAEEIRFFKEIKPLFIAQFIYYAAVLSIEASKPNAGQQALRDYYSLELHQLQSFIDEHSSFYDYYRRKATYLDEKYFTRRQLDFKMAVDPNVYSYDENFSTSHDQLVARIIANDRLERFLLSAVYNVDGYFFEKFSDKSPVAWTGSKAALVELLYALHAMNFINNGTADFSEMVKFAEKTLNINLGNYYKTLHEIKNRKTGRSKFLTGLAEQLEKHFDNQEQ